jgi:hypothetical protein
MPTLKPTFALNIGSLQSTTAAAAGGPTRFLVERDMDTAADGLQITLMDSSDIAIGDAVTLALGHDGDEQTVFTGTVAALRPVIAGMQIQAIGAMRAVLALYTASAYLSKTAGDVANDLINQAGGVAGTVEDGPTLPRFMVDRRRSAFVHLKGLADRLGFELFTDRDGKIMFQPLGSAATLDAGSGLLGGVAAAAVAAAGALLGGGGEGYAFGKHLIYAQGAHTSPQWDAVDVGGESPMSGQGDKTEYWLTTDDSSYKGSAGDGTQRRLVIDGTARTKDVADRLAAGYLALAGRRSRELRITVLGRPQLDLGSAISVSDLPNQDSNGSGYVCGLCHRFDVVAGFVTIVRIAMDPAA